GVIVDDDKGLARSREPPNRGFHSEGKFSREEEQNESKDWNGDKSTGLALDTVVPSLGHNTRSKSRFRD
ncbi:unnamed protein product, partial [Ilex paraguariensis]